MLFNSIEYFLAFLPLSIIVYFAFVHRRFFIASKVWLLVCSLFFYCYWKFDYIWILLASIVFNFTIGAILSDLSKSSIKTKLSKYILILGIISNVLLLVYYKYTDFLINDVNLLFNLSFNLQYIVLPLAISFFSFQQIAYLVDSYRGETKEYDFLSYAIFVSFFPQLIAGPIVHHKDLILQFFKAKNLHINYKNMCLGLLIFTIGIIKKAIIADKFAIWVAAGFSNTESLNLVTAWMTSLCYTFQLYFDFSGYCDMAIGSALFLNIRLPINFNSPYKALSIQDFWRRWHITLSSFLRDYLYFPLGGSKKGNGRTYINLFILFLITGIWHGASNMFVLWGLVNGIAIIIHRFFHLHGGKLPKIPAWIITFLLINFAWVLFRSPDITSALNIYIAMLNFDSLNNPNFTSFKSIIETIGFSGNTVVYIVLAFIIVLFTKNSSELLVTFEKIQLTKIQLLKNKFYQFLFAFFISILIFYVVISVISSNYTEFIYFNF